MLFKHNKNKASKILTWYKIFSNLDKLAFIHSFIYLGIRLFWKSTMQKYKKNIKEIGFILDNCDLGAQNQSLGYICSNSQKYIVIHCMGQNYRFLFYAKYH